MELIKRTTVEDVVNKRNAALASYAEAWRLLSEAQEKVSEARGYGDFAGDGTVGRYSHHLDKERIAFHKEFRVPSREEYLETARRIVDTDGWSYLIGLMRLEMIMDAQSKQEFRDSLIKDAPPLELEHVLATLAALKDGARTTFLRSIANIFAAADRRFRSHDGFKIGRKATGNRIIFPHALRPDGGWSWTMDPRPALIDIERMLLILDEKTQGYTSEIVAALDKAGKHWSGPGAVTVETDYLKVRTFKNGNMHVYFLRPDLLEKVNLCLAEYYGEVLGERGEDVEEKARADADLNTPKMTLARNFGFFPTPEPAVEHMLHPLGQNLKGKRVLEPSAGTGNLARVLRQRGASVDCVEIQPDLAKGLRLEGFPCVTADFLTLAPPTDPELGYDLVVMNPPFDRERDVDHVMHALKFLKPGGGLISIMSAGTEFRSTRKGEAFRKHILSLVLSERDIARAEREDLGWVEAMRLGRWSCLNWQDLPPASFAEVGTYVNTGILTVYPLPHDRR